MLEAVLLVLVVVVLVRTMSTPRRLTELQDELSRQHERQVQQDIELERLRQQLLKLQAGGVAPAAEPRAPAAPVVPAARPAAPVAVPPVAVPRPVGPPAATPGVVPAPPAPRPVERPGPLPAPAFQPEPVLAATPAPELSVAALPVALPPPAPPRRPVYEPAPEPSGPTWWERASAVLLENWTGILGAVVLVTGVGFLGIYTALQITPPYRFLLICLFAVGLLGARWALRRKAFARQLNAWLLSSAAAIFLFACVGAVSIPGLRWATAPFDYLLLLAGVSANLYLAWRSSREEVSTLHGVLSLVALAVLPPTALTLGAAAGVTAFSIAITYRQQWRYQLLLSIASFFVFHLYWHRQLAVVPGTLRLTAMVLVLLVGAAAALVQYRRVYAQRRFEPLLFAAHLLNWTCLGFNLYLHSTGSPWKTVPLALGALLTYWTGQQAKRLGIGWLFQTDTIISLMLALAAALSLQGWHATPAVVGLFMLLEALLVALVMARQREALVYRVALVGALLAGVGMLLVTYAYAGAAPLSRLYRDALALALAGGATLAFVQLIFRQPLLAGPGSAAADEDNPDAPLLHQQLLSGLAGVAGALQAGAGGLLAVAVFSRAGAPVAGLLPVLVALAGAALALGRWVQVAGLAPDWVRRQQLVLAQALAATAVLGLHELGLIWPAVLLALYAETLLAVLLLARCDSGLHRAGLGAALLAGVGLLLVATSHVADGQPAELWRDAGLLALAAVLSVAFARHSYRQLASASSPVAEADVSELYQALLGWLAGLGGLLQAGVGLLLGRLLFHWPAVPPGYGLAALLALAALALAGAAWVGRRGAVPAWVQRQQLILGHSAVVLAVAGLHQLGLSWPGVGLALYAEGLLAAALLHGRRHDDLLHLQTYLLLVQAATLPLLVRYTGPTLGELARAALLVGAALLTVLYQARRRFLPGEQPEYARLPLPGELYLPLLGLAAGGLLLSAGGYCYERLWAGWAVLALLGGLLALRRRVAVPGLWAGLLLAAVGYLALQWGSWRLWPSPVSTLFDQAGYVGWGPGWQRLRLFYLLPTTLLPLVALATYWWPGQNRFVRWPWLYLLGMHLLVTVLTTATTLAWAMLLVLAIALAAYAAALRWRRSLPDEAAVARAGQPDRYLLHLAYVLLAGSLLLHLGVLGLSETFFGQPAGYFTATALFAALVGLALACPPATGPVYRSWQWLHPWLPEAALLFGSATLAHHLRWPWQPLVWVSAALALSYAGPRLPLRFRRLAVYGRLYYWLAAGAVAVVCLLYVSPGYILQPGWWALVAAVALLFGYVALALREGGATVPGLSPAWDRLARPSRRELEATLLYPAFVALSLLLIQSFDRSVLTVLLMLEVLAVFSASLLLRRQDLRYVALAGMLGCLVRLVFFDLSRSGTITRAIVFIFMGLLLLGMNALYARFKNRFAADEPADNPPDEAAREEFLPGDADALTNEPQPL